MKKFIILLSMSIISVSVVHGQKIINLQVDQPEALALNTGKNFAVCAGTKVLLGTNIEVSNNVGDVFYSWSPMDKLNDPTSPNPTIIAGNSQEFQVTIIDSRGCAVHGEVIVKAILCDDLIRESEGSARVYPNPATDRITIELPLAENNEHIMVKVVNGLGQTVVEQLKAEMAGERMIQLSVNELQPGIYFIQLISGKRLFVERIQIN
jgi:hypothetical protein